MKKKIEQKLNEFKKASHHRGFLLEKNHIDEDSRTVQLAFSSEDPYERWFGMEILGHKKSEVDLTRMSDAPLLVGHDHSDQVGVIEDVSIDSDARGRAVVRFGKSARASEIFQDVVDGIRRQVSVGYYVNEMKLEKETDEGPDEYRVTKWQPFEVSMVSVAADPTVGVGRNAEELNIKTPKEEIKMGDYTPEKAPVSIDVDAERETARAEERSRVSELLATGQNYDAAELAQKHIDAGGSVDDLNRDILKRNGQNAIKAEDPVIGMSEKEAQRFSITKAINALANPQDHRAQKDASFEFECSRAACDVMKKESQGIMIPADVLTRDLNVGTAIDGGNLVATDLMSGSFIDKLENALAVNQAGATILTGLNGNIAIPRQTGGTSHYWLAESGTPTEASATFDQVALTPKTVGAYTEISRKLIQQSSIAVEGFVQNELALRLALAIDSAAVSGTGASNQPEGILNTTGIGSVAGGTNGLAPTWSHVVQLESAVANDNAAMGNMMYLTNTKVRGILKETEKFSGGGREIWTGDTNPLNGYGTVVSNQVPSTLTKGSASGICSAIIFGNFADLIIGMWGGLDLQVNPYSLDTSGAVRVTAFQDTDISVRHPESFSAMLDALTS